MSELFKRVLFSEQEDDISFKTWESKVYKPRLEYGRKQLAELKLNPYSTAKTDNEKLQMHLDNMQKIAVSVISETLENMSHQKCSSFLQNAQRLEQIVYEGTQQAVECPDINVFYPKMQLPVAETHKTLCRNICEQIREHWNEYYVLKDIEMHDPLRFQKHFIKNLAPLTVSHAFSDGFSPALATEGPPPMAPLQMSIRARNIDETVSREIDLLEPPPLIPHERSSLTDQLSWERLTDSDLAPPPLFPLENSLSDSLPMDDSVNANLEPPPMIPLENESSLSENLTWDKEASQLPPVPKFMPYSELRSEKLVKSDKPPPLKWMTPVDSSIRGNADETRRKLARQKLRPVTQTPAIDIAMGWLKNALEEGKIDCNLHELYFFAPSNKVVQTLNEVPVPASVKDSIIRNTLGRHLCVTNHAGGYFSLKGNKPIRVDQNKIVHPVVSKPTLHEAESIEVGPYKISCFAHDNLITED